MNDEQIQTAATDLTQNSMQTILPDASSIDAVDSSIAPSTAMLPEMPLPISKQAQRYQLACKLTTARCEIESQVSAALNAKCGQRYKGTFEVRFDMLNEVTTKALSAFCSNGAVFFTPEDLDQHPALKNIRKSQDGIDLSALMNRVKRPTNIDDTSWHQLEEMWSEVSTTLYSQGLAPMHILIAGVLAAKGLGGPKINKKLCANINADTGNMHEVMCQILDDLNEQLVQHPTIK